jgi:hypothetical protein
VRFNALVPGHTFDFTGGRAVSLVLGRCAGYALVMLCFRLTFVSMV